MSKQLYVSRDDLSASLNMSPHHFSMVLSVIGYPKGEIARIQSTRASHASMKGYPLESSIHFLRNRVERFDDASEAELRKRARPARHGS